MQSISIISKAGLTPIINQDVLFNNETIAGTCSKEFGERGLYKAVSITLEDNEANQNDLNACTLDYNTVKEIAYTCDTLYTNYGLDVHSSSFKSKPFSNLKIVRI